MKKGSRILVIEDEQDIRELLVAFLEGDGYEVSMARNGREALEALEKARAAPPHAILLDMMMPVMDGRELLGHLAADPVWAGIPVIIMTAANLPVEGLNVRTTIRKPFRAAQLLALIASI